MWGCGIERGTSIIRASGTTFCFIGWEWCLQDLERKFGTRFPGLPALVASKTSIHRLESLTDRLQSTDLVECRVSILGIIFMFWESIPIAVPRILWVNASLNPLQSGGGELPVPSNTSWSSCSASFGVLGFRLGLGF